MNNYTADYKFSQEHQQKSRRFPVFPGEISNSRRFPVFPGSCRHPVLRQMAARHTVIQTVNILKKKWEGTALTVCHAAASETGMNIRICYTAHRDNFHQILH